MNQELPPEMPNSFDEQDNDDEDDVANEDGLVLDDSYDLTGG
jgi:hypothetical protein